MKNIVRLEEAAMAALGIYFLTFHNLNISTGIWLFIFFSPDISILGYLVNAKVGAISYNVFHQLLSFLSAPFIHFIFPFFLGRAEYRPFWKIPFIFKLNLT